MKYIMLVQDSKTGAEGFLDTFYTFPSICCIHKSSLKSYCLKIIAIKVERGPETIFAVLLCIIMNGDYKSSEENNRLKFKGLSYIGRYK